MVIDRQTGSVVQTIPYPAPEALFLGLVFSPDGKRVFASGGGNNKIRTYDVRAQQLVESDSIPLPTTDKDGKKINPYPAGLAIAADSATLFVANNLDDSLSLLDVANRTLKTTLAVGHNPSAVGLAEDAPEL